MSNFRIALLSTDPRHLAELAARLRAEHGANEIEAVEDGLGRWSASARKEAPDLLIVDGAGVAELPALERLSTLYPSMALMVLNADMASDFLLRAMRAGVREVLPTPTAPGDLEAAVARIRDKRNGQQDAGGKILAFISCKGGSGATFLATNLGYTLAALQDKKVLLIDLNLQFGDASLFVSEEAPRTTLADLAQQLHRLDAAFLAASLVEVAPNYGVLAAPEDPARAIDVRPEHVEALLTLARRHYDFVILDVGRQLDAVTLKALDLADLIFPVVQLTLPFIRDSKRLVSVFRSLDYPKSKINLIVNRYETGSTIRLEDLEEALGVKVFRTVPNSYAAAAASVNQGVPILKLARHNPIARSLQELGAFLAQTPGQERRGWLARALKRA